MVLTVDSPTLFSLSLVRQFAPFLSRMGSSSFRRWLVEKTPNETVQRVKRMSGVMHGTARSILDEKRRDSGTARERKDIISVLCESKLSIIWYNSLSGIVRANEKASVNEKMSENELTGQMT